LGPAEENPVARAYGVEAIPATFLIDANGKVIGKDLSKRELRRQLSESVTADRGD
jgi:hypothetical protein